MPPTIALHKIKSLVVGALLMFCAPSQALESDASASINMHRLSQQLEVGDVVFIQVTPYPFQKVASTTQSWVNHVGIVVDTSGEYATIAESTFPLSKRTAFNTFVARSGHGKVAVSRLTKTLTHEEKVSIQRASNKRLGIFYDTGFNLHSNREFCSRFVREVIHESTGESVGEVETFKQLLDKTPASDLAFWRIWYFGNIPWDRETVSPASLYRSANLRTVFEGNVI